MLIQQFPDIQWLKAKIQEGFNDQKAVDDLPLKHKGWPSVVLNTKTRAAERRDIKGPFSFFANLSGSSTIGIEGKQFQINEQCYALSNEGQHYDLLIDEKGSTETFNIHFGEHFFATAIHALSSTDKYLLDDPFVTKPDMLHISPHLMTRTPQLELTLKNLCLHYESHEPEEKEETLLFDLLQELLTANSKEIIQVQNLPIQSKATRDEIVSRLYLSRDYLHSYFFRDISLDQLSQISCLSKFHFLRLFKQAFGFSPYQYQKHLRMQRVLALYREGATLEFIATQVGMENASSVSRMIRKKYGAYPSQIVQ